MIFRGAIPSGRTTSSICAAAEAGSISRKRNATAYSARMRCIRRFRGPTAPLWHGDRYCADILYGAAGLSHHRQREGDGSRS